MQRFFMWITKTDHVQADKSVGRTCSKDHFLTQQLVSLPRTNRYNDPQQKTGHVPYLCNECPN